MHRHVDGPKLGRKLGCQQIPRPFPATPTMEAGSSSTETSQGPLGDIRDLDARGHGSAGSVERRCVIHTATNIALTRPWHRRDLTISSLSSGMAHTRTRASAVELRPKTQASEAKLSILGQAGIHRKPNHAEPNAEESGSLPQKVPKPGAMAAAASRQSPAIVMTRMCPP